MIEGLSGCKIEVNPPYLIKTNGNFPADRLAKQGNKQKEFRISRDIIVPKVHEILNDGINASIKMDYYPAMDSVTFLETATIPEIKDWIGIILNWISTNITDHSGLGTIHDLRLPVTLADVPVGPTHGDLTLSNILYYQKKIVFIDLLDSIDTPLIDFAKLRQDTKYRWSFFLSGRMNNRLDSVLKFIDAEVEYEANLYPAYKTYGSILEKYCLKRILPYCQKSEQTKFIEDALCQP
jgi:hypothetical protein